MTSAAIGTSTIAARNMPAKPERQAEARQHARTDPASSGSHPSDLLALRATRAASSRGRLLPR